MNKHNHFHVNDIRIILIDNTDQCKINYQSGDYISGKVVIQVKGRLPILLLNINLNCIAQVHWIDLPGIISMEGCKIRDEKEYLKYDYQLPLENSNLYLEDGTYEIPFSFLLPEDGIPSSYESEWGTISYMIEAFVMDTTIDERFRTEKFISVESPIKQNLFQSVWGSTEKELGIFSFGSGQITLHAIICKKGYQPGEFVKVLCRVGNDSTTDVRPRAMLYQIQSFMTEQRHKTIEKHLTDAVFGDIIKEGMTAESDMQLEIPDGIPLSLKSPNITVKYYIHVTLSIHFSQDMHLNLPIIITSGSALDNITLYEFED